MKRTIAAMAFTAGVFLLLSSCLTSGGIPGFGGALTRGLIQKGGDEPQEKQSTLSRIGKTADAVEKSFEDITPEQEYYIGRSVGAIILDTYKPYKNEKANAYINNLGQLLALMSDRPVTFAGYRFLILDTDEINAFAAPSGHIFVSRGLLRLAKNEAMVAAILAHEIGHVQEQHGLKAIKKGRVTSALALVGTTAAATMGSAELAELTEVFGDTITDITEEMVSNGYARADERAADRAAVEILVRVGYDPYALVDILQAMNADYDPEGKGFNKTHPDPEDRIETVTKKIGSDRSSGAANPAGQQSRFNSALGRI